MERLPDISVVITCFNEEANIADCLAGLVTQSYPAEKYEIIVVDGNSTDTTITVIEAIARQQKNISLLIEPKKGTAAGRNTGIRAARFDHVAFIDADCEAPPEWLEVLAVNYLKQKQQNPAIIAVGGKNIPPVGADFFMRAIGVSLDSYMGSFNSAQGRQFFENRPVDSLATLNVLYDKATLEKIGCFDETLASEAEDADLNFRLKQAGYGMFFISQSYVWHKMRPTPASWLKNMFRYGKGRARLLKRYPAMWRPSFVLPLLFAGAMVSLLLAPISQTALAGLCYFPLLLVFSLGQCLRKREPLLFLHVAFVYLIQHFGYAAGEVYGLINPAVR
ncbi:MAG: glycosyltransferase [Proteobacteria bacterium]|nr:glycosyltransferase [Pseudomonadota bacterium]MBU4296682.1 glycosyltransferase [Pseudomonadota bacterium]MCG2748475.1 glycosyltransferase [Desulfobulbaceae bacterium]